MRILIPQTVCKRLISALEKTQDNEIGGILLGEHEAENTFRIVDLTIQSHGGSRSTFFRQVREALIYLSGFFRRTNYNYKRYNYLGEWHSHPSYVLHPSNTDNETMWDIIHDNRVGANFVVLLIVQLANEGLEARAIVYLPNYISAQAQLIFEVDESS